MLLVDDGAEGPVSGRVNRGELTQAQGGDGLAGVELEGFGCHSYRRKFGGGRKDKMSTTR
jgi:hypothetical protein